MTAADLLLGCLHPNFFLGGEMRLDIEAAKHSVGRFASAIGLRLEQAAAAIHRVVNENMAAAARMHAIERRRDLRRFTHVATGGAGPVHACGVARALGIPTVVIPPAAGVASAFGMLTARPSFDFTRSLPARLSEISWNAVRSFLQQMGHEGMSHLHGVGVKAEEVRLEIGVDVRHLGQGESLTVQLGPELASNPASQVEEAFEHAELTLGQGVAVGHQAVELLMRRATIQGISGRPK